MVDQTLFTDQVPANLNNADTTIYGGFGTAFSAAVAGAVKGIRLYAATTVPSVAVRGALFSQQSGTVGTLLDSKLFGALAPGWNTVLFDAPIAIAAGASYIAVGGPIGNKYVSTGGLFVGAVLTNGDLTAPASTTGNKNGRYAPAGGELAYPTLASPTPSCYFVDVIFEATPAVPAVPTGLAAVAGDAQVALSWTASPGATSYEVYRGGALIASPAGASHLDTGRTNGTAYSYTVKAVNAVGASAASGAVSATPSAVPATPTGLAALAGDAQVLLSWTASATATSYEVYRGGALVASPAGTSHLDVGLVNGTAYSYTVKAVNAVGASTAAAPVVVTPAAAAPAPPPASAAERLDARGRLLRRVSL